MKSLFKAIATVSLFSLITRALGFFFRIFISRKLGAEGMGLFQMASSVLGIFLTLVSSGIPLATAKLVSKYETNLKLKKRNQLVGSALVVALVVACISCVCVNIFRPIWCKILTDSRAVDVLLILSPAIIASAIYAVFRGALWGQNDYFNCGLTELIEQIIRFALTFIMLFNITDFFTATKYSAIAFDITCVASAIVTIFIYFKSGKTSFYKGEYKNIIKSAAPITGVRLASSFVQSITTLIIPSMLVLAGYSTSEAVASFGVIMGMTFPMLFVPMSVVGSISMVLIPSISAMLVKNDYVGINNNISSAVDVSVFIAMIFVPVYIAIGDLIGIILFNNAMSGVLLQISAICVVPITLCNLTGSILNSLNLEIKSFINYIIGSAVLFICLITLTPLIGINSVIVAFFLSMGCISLLNLRKIKKVVPGFNFNLFGCSVKYACVVTPISLLCHFIANICLHFLNYFISACIAGSICVVLTLLLCHIFNIYNISSLIKLVKNRKTRTA